MLFITWFCGWNSVERLFEHLHSVAYTWILLAATLNVLWHFLMSFINNDFHCKNGMKTLKKFFIKKWLLDFFFILVYSPFVFPLKNATKRTAEKVMSNLMSSNVSFVFIIIIWWNENKLWKWHSIEIEIFRFYLKM